MSEQMIYILETYEIHYIEMLSGNTKLVWNELSYLIFNVIFGLLTFKINFQNDLKFKHWCIIKIWVFSWYIIFLISVRFSIFLSINFKCILICFKLELYNNIVLLRSNLVLIASLNTIMVYKLVTMLSNFLL